MWRGRGLKYRRVNHAGRTGVRMVADMWEDAVTSWSCEGGEAQTRQHGTGIQARTRGAASPVPNMADLLTVSFSFDHRAGRFAVMPAEIGAAGFTLSCMIAPRAPGRRTEREKNTSRCESFSF